MITPPVGRVAAERKVKANRQIKPAERGEERGAPLSIAQKRLERPMIFSEAQGRRHTARDYR